MRAIAIQSDGKILVGGDFTKVGEQTRNFIARLDGTSGDLDSFNANAKGVVFAIAIQADGKILVGGQFNGENSIGGADRNYIARLDATTGLADSYDPNANGAVFSIVLQSDGKALVGGVFHGENSIGGATRNYIARLDGANGGADSFNPNASAAVNAIAVEADGEVLVGGAFFGPHGMGGEARNYIARLVSTTGAVDSSFDPSAGGAVHSIAVQTDGGILLGGAFMKIGDQSRNRIARLNGDSTLAASSGSDWDILRIGHAPPGQRLPISLLFCALCAVPMPRRRLRKKARFSSTLSHVVAIVTLATLLSSSNSLANTHLSRNNGNGRYFSDENGKAVYLTGSHTWNNFLDGGWEAVYFHNPDIFKYNDYLDWMQSLGHNFIRLWTPDNARDFESCTPDPEDPTCRELSPGQWYRALGQPVTPTLYERHSGSAAGWDGLPPFNLNQLNQDYFDRLRERIIAARDKGIYVSIMLFDGWGVGVYGHDANNDNGLLWWLGHPYNFGNNLEGITGGDPTGMNAPDAGLICETELPASDVRTLQEDYIRKVIDTVKDLDNVLFEICNEAWGVNPWFPNLHPGLDSTQWQYDLIDFIHKIEANVEADSPIATYLHPVGMTGQSYSTNNELINSPADWISLLTDGNGTYETDLPMTDGSKVIILDTDHLQNNLFNYDNNADNRATRVWVWKCFTRGYNPIYMDQMYSDPAFGGAAIITIEHSPHAEEVRTAMDYTRAYTERMDLIDMTPQPALSQTGYALANVGSEYLVYQWNQSHPAFSTFWVNLPTGNYTGEWFNPDLGMVDTTPVSTNGGGQITFTQPFAGDAVLYLKAN